MKHLIRNIIIIAVVIILGLVGYKIFFSGKAAAPTAALQTTAGVGAGTSGAPQVATTSAASAGDTSVGQDFLTTLLSVESITLDDSIFKNKGFALLQDFNRPIPPDDNPGRPNPFAPIGVDGAAGTAQVSTSNPSSITSTSSTLNGTLVASDPNATRWFEYGTTSSFGQMTAPKTQTIPGAFAEAVTGLLSNTTYYVRADASVGGSTIIGNTLTWRTAQNIR